MILVMGIYLAEISCQWYSSSIQSNATYINNQGSVSTQYDTVL